MGLFTTFVVQTGASILKPSPSYTPSPSSTCTPSFQNRLVLRPCLRSTSDRQLAALRTLSRSNKAIVVRAGDVELLLCLPERAPGGAGDHLQPRGGGDIKGGTSESDAAVHDEDVAEEGHDLWVPMVVRSDSSTTSAPGDHIAALLAALGQQQQEQDV